MDSVIKFFKKYLGRDTPINNLENKNKVKEIIDEIHDLMLKNYILPRELLSGRKLLKLISEKKIDFFNNNSIPHTTFDLLMDDFKVILSVIFPRSRERKMEIYCNLIISVEDFLGSNFDFVENCISCKKGCFLTKPDYIYYRLGIDTSMDDIEGDLPFDILKKNFKTNFLSFYGYCLFLSILKVIKKNLILIKEYYENKNSLFKFPNDLNKITNMFDFNNKKDLSLFCRKQTL